MRQISDADPSLMKICECMASISAHASKLKSDDVNIKGFPVRHRVYLQSELYALENIHHIVMQCPGFYNLMVQMYEEIEALNGGISLRFEEEPSQVFHWLLGYGIEGVDTSDLWMLWKTSGTFVTKM